MRKSFRRFAEVVAEALGSPWAFLTAAAAVGIWLAVGPLFQFGPRWESFLIIGIAILTFLMIFVVQNTQNRTMKTLHLKLDELLRGVEGSRTGLVNLEKLSDEELKQLEAEFVRLKARETRQEAATIPQGRVGAKTKASSQGSSPAR